MIFRYLDKAVDKGVAQMFSKGRKVGRRLERAYYSSYKHWLVYISRRSKDKSVKMTMFILAYCTFAVFRALIDLMYMSPTMQVDVPYSAHLKMLDNFNEGKPIEEDHEQQKIGKVVKMDRSQQRTITDFLNQRGK